MRKIPGRILFFILLLISVFLLPASLYVKNANYYGALSVTYNREYHGNINVLGISPIGSELKLNSKENGYSYDYPRFYNKGVIKLQHALTDTLQIKLQFNDSLFAIIAIPPGVTIQDINLSSYTRHSFIRKFSELICFINNVKWLKILFVIMAILIIVLLLFLIRKKINHFTSKLIFRFQQWNILLIDLKKRVLINLLLFFILLVVGILTIPISGNKYFSYDNYVHIQNSPDQADYQTIAVNFAVKDQFMVNGMIHENTNYRIFLDNTGDSAVNKFNFNNLHYNKGLICLHRFPAYPLFLGLIYKITGTCPLIIKYLQLLALLMVVFSFPLFGYSLWGKKGFWSGAIAAPFFFTLIFPLTTCINPDLITVVFNFFIVWAHIRFRASFKLKDGIVLGLLCGTSILFRASLMFFFPFLFLDLFIIVFRAKNFALIKQIIFVGLIFLFCWVPYNIWSVSAAKEIKNNVISLFETINKTPDVIKLNQNINQSLYGSIIKRNISNLTLQDIAQYRDTLKNEVETTGVVDMVHLNLYRPNSLYLAYYEMMIQHFDFYFMIMLFPVNEAMNCHNEYVKNGIHSSAWIKDSKSFYNNDGLKGEISAIRIMNFYWHYPGKIFSLSFQKQKNIFDQITVFKWFDFLIVLLLFPIIFLMSNKRKVFRIGVAIICVLFLLILFLFPDINVVLFPLVVCGGFISKRIRSFLPLPLNLLLISILIYPPLSMGVPLYVCYYIFPVFLSSGYIFVLLLQWLIDINNKQNDIPVFPQ